MEEKYIAAVKVGIAGGLLIAVLTFLELVLEIITGRVSEEIAYVVPRLLSCGIYILCVLIPALAGVFIIRKAIEKPGNVGEAAMTALSGGLAAGIIVVLSLLAIAFIKPFVIVKQYDDVGTTLMLNGVTGAIINTISVAICCAPIIFVVCIVSTVIGALIYYVATDKSEIGA